MKPTKCEEQGRAAGHRPPTQSAARWMPTFTSLHAAFQKGFLHAPLHMFALQNHSKTTPEHALSLHWHCPSLLAGPSSAYLPPVPAQSVGLIFGLVPEDVAHLHPSFHPFICSRGLLSFCLPRTLGYTTVNSSDHWGWGKPF